MPNHRLNQRQRKNLKRSNKDGYLAPPKDFGYPGRPIHRSHTEKLRNLIRETASSIKPRTDEEVQSQLRFLNGLDSATSDELVDVLLGGGFKLVKLKELRVHVNRTDQPIPPSARVRTGQAIGKGRTATIFTVNAR